MMWHSLSTTYQGTTPAVRSDSAWLAPQIAGFERQLVESSVSVADEEAMGGVSILSAELAAKEAQLQRAEVVEPPCNSCPVIPAIQISHGLELTPLRLCCRLMRARSDPSQRPRSCLRTERSSRRNCGSSRRWSSSSGGRRR